MALPAPNITIQDHSRRPKPYLRVKTLKQWLIELPTANNHKATQIFIDQVDTINQSRYPVHERIQLLDTLRPTARQLLLTLKQYTKKAIIPLGRRGLEAYNLSQQLLDVMASGYKIVLSDLIALNSHKEHNQLQLREAIYIVIQYLSRQLVEAYLVYAPEPKGVWHDLHQLYLYSEERGINALPLDDPYPDFSLPMHYTIDLAYKRILMLALVEPRHMMQGEADDIFYLVSAWTGACHLLPLDNTPLEGEYAVAMASDKPPRFVSRDIAWEAVNARIIELSEVKQRLEVQLQRFLRTSLATIDHNEKQSLVARHQRDMLLRLSEAWNGAPARATSRRPIRNQVQLAAGLSASHYYLSSGEIFTPELDELKLKTEEIEPTVFATAYETAMQKDSYHLNKSYNIRPWWQHNTSESGTALACSTNCENTHVKVGEVVAYRDQHEATSHWKLGVVRWLRSDPDNGLDLGIMNLSNSAVPIAIKGLKGPGFGTDYFRGLLIPKQVSLHQTRSILVPASVYDVHSELAVNMKQRLFYIRFKSLLRSTNEFSQFTFDVMASAPISDVEVFVS
jgi:hypothetical protein